MYIYMYNMYIHIYIHILNGFVDDPAQPLLWKVSGCFDHHYGAMACGL